jgi:hypothetical protein
MGAYGRPCCLKDQEHGMEESLHPLQQTLRDNGELIAAQATIAQQAQRIKHLEDETALQQYGITAMRTDPDVVLIGMLNGHIAKLSVRSFVKTHCQVVNGDEAQLLEIARLREACNKEFESVQIVDTENAQLRLQCAALQAELDEHKALAQTDQDNLIEAFGLFSTICKMLEIDPYTLENSHDLLPAIDRLLDEVATWKANHADMVVRNKLLLERPDLPVDRVPAMTRLIDLQVENRALRHDLTRQADISLSLAEVISEVAAPLGIDAETIKESGPDVLLNAINNLLKKTG